MWRWRDSHSQVSSGSWCIWVLWQLKGWKSLTKAFWPHRLDGCLGRFHKILMCQSVYYGQLIVELTLNSQEFGCGAWICECQYEQGVAEHGVVYLAQTYTNLQIELTLHTQPNLKCAWQATSFIKTRACKHCFDCHIVEVAQFLILKGWVCARVHA